MGKRILIEHTDGRRSLALLDGEGQLLFFSRETQGVQAEQIYIGVVERMVAGMEAAFVQLGRGQAGFLPFSECIRPPRSGEKLLVQVKKPGTGGKAPYLTADVALPGRYVILTPQKAACGVSKKITDDALRCALMEQARRLAPEGMGLVMRAEAPNAEEEQLRSEIDALRSQWQLLLARLPAAQPPCLLRDREDALARLLRDEHGSISEVLADREEGLSPLPCPVRICSHPFRLYNVEGQKEKALQRRVFLPCGGYLIIDKTEALTVIDVNSGAFTGDRSGAENAFLRLNLEAARECARLMRLRAMGGIILIDFVDMLSDDSRRQVAQEMESALRDDPVKTVVHGFSHLGLMEITRKKTETAL